MAWRSAKSLVTLRAQVDAAWPNRSKSSDGTIGDSAHAATKSDHNPNPAGVVQAIDITNDPTHGVSARGIAEALVASRDPRIKYIISNAQICSSKTSPWVWRPYSGANAHTKHVHISVMDDPALYDDARPWSIPGTSTSTPAAYTKFRSLVPGGFYSSTPFDLAIPTAIRTNNPGALNASAWVKAYPGYVGDKVTSMSGASANNTAIFETPEQGVAAWWELMSRYRGAGAKTIAQIIKRYGGGQDYSAYEVFVTTKTGLPSYTEIKLSGDDANLVKFARAMFRYEAGRETPLSDAQILKGFEIGRAKGQVAGGTIAVGGAVAAGVAVAQSGFSWGWVALAVVVALIGGFAAYRYVQRSKATTEPAK